MQLLTPSERRALLNLARESILSALDGEARRTGCVLSPALSAPSGAFVSLHQRGELRGCIGTLATARSLHDSVAHLAVAAAFDDPRFPPLTRAELAQTEIEISRLSAAVPARPEDILVPRHGVAISIGERRAVFLPQVARHQQWDRERLLAELCRKADLPCDAWKEPAATLLVFEAETFGDIDGAEE